MNIIETFNPLLTSALERYQRFNNPEPRDLQKIFGPALATICNVAGVDPTRSVELISAWDPAAVTVETIRGAVAQITAPTMADMNAAKARQRALEAEIAADIAAHPPTERQKLQAMRRTTPLAARSRDSIYEEMRELTSGCIASRFCDVYDAPGDTRYCRGERIPDAALRAMPHTVVELQAELDRRDCEAEGVEYVPMSPKNSGHPWADCASTSSVKAMRG